jgi:hypothetical protein
LDTKGPEIRTGFLKDGKSIVLSKGQDLFITTDYEVCFISTFELRAGNAHYFVEMLRYWVTTRFLPALTRLCQLQPPLAVQFWLPMAPS